MTPNPTHRLADQLWQLHSMEARMATAFPVLAGSAMHTQLRSILSQRAKRARERRDELESISAHHGSVSHAVICPAIRGILTEGDRELARIRDPHTRDVVLVVHWMRVEQYATVAYGIAAPVANRIGFPEVADQMSALLSDLTAARASLQCMEAVVSRIAEAQGVVHTAMAKPLVKQAVEVPSFKKQYALEAVGVLSGHG